MLSKRVFGILGIQSIMANWNADFTGFPKSTSSNEVFGSDKAFKFPMKKYWDANGEKVIYLKSFKAEEIIKSKKKTGEIKLQPKDLSERYTEKFGDVLSECKDTTKVAKNLFSAIDVKNFGCAFPVEGHNISITGAVQIGQGFNKYDNIDIVEQQILSPFRNSKDDDAANSTLGTKIVSREAQYFYPFAINPTAYKNYIDINVTEGYTEEDYKKFKKAALVGATFYNSNSKLGCENSFGLFLETSDDIYLGDLTPRVTFTKGEDKNIISIKLEDLISDLKEKVENIEIYYNPFITKIHLDINIDNDKVNFFNIVTQTEISKELPKKEDKN